MRHDRAQLHGKALGLPAGDVLPGLIVWLWWNA